MKVLLLDELEIIRDGLELLLRDFFTIERITHASDGGEALKKAGRRFLSFGIDGFGFCRGVRGIETFLK